MIAHDFADRYGPWAVIAGGSDGTGAAFARRVAEQGVNLVLLARRPDPLAELAAELEVAHRIEVRTGQVDLAQPGAADEITDITADLDVGLLIYNAGATMGFNHWTDWSEADITHMVTMNCLTTSLLARRLAEPMCERGRGGIVLVGSMAGLAGSAFQSVYNASKAFDWILAEGLWQELGIHGVDALALLLGATRTESHERMDADFEGQTTMAPDDVAVEGLANLHAGPVYVVGEHNRQTLPFLLSEDRRTIVAGMSEASAKIARRPHRPVPERDQPDSRE
jgi:short-subunit dehydrogenase